MAKKSKAEIRLESLNADYKIGIPLGEGGNAVVHLATNRSTNKVVAVKVLTNLGKEKKIRFADEIKIMQGNADIPGILPILDSNTEHFWYVMPIAIPVFDHSGTLLKKSPEHYDRAGIDRNEWMKDIIGGFIQLAETLECLHARGIHHRDIKPDNIYLYNDRYTLGDFGLVDFPDNDNNLTRNDKGLGAIFTIAPEMKRNPLDADGAKADVYSLAKTLWIMLSRDEKGFDGQYSWNDKSQGLRFYGHLNNEYLVEIEELLYGSTSNAPTDRPSISQFKDTLRQWLDIYSMQSYSEREKREWKFIASRIFGENVPVRSEFSEPDVIVGVLNKLALLHASNHMMMPGGGGLDFSGAEIAPEPGFIYVYADGFINLLKPKALYYESFKDSRWNYWMIECEDVAQIPNVSTEDQGEQELVEDLPAHYIQGEDSVYGVYDYDSGIPLPEGWKRVTRYTRGNFLIVMKTCTYNHIIAAYDGRHSDMTNDEFRRYIDGLQVGLSTLTAKGLSERQVLTSPIFEQHPYPHRSRRASQPINNDAHTLPSPDDFIKENFRDWNFSDLLPEERGEGKLAFRFIFKPDQSGFIDVLESFLDDTENNSFFLSEDGNIVKEEPNCPPPLEVYDRKIAINILNNLNQRLKEICDGFDMEDIMDSEYWDIEWRRIASPSHLFTKDEIIEEMRNADDRLNNQLVIDEDGYAHVIPVDGTHHGELYPVSHSIWGGRKNYVGRYSDLPTASDNYRESLARWLTHLKTGRQVSNYGNTSKDSETLIAEITPFMTPEE